MLYVGKLLATVCWLGVTLDSGYFQINVRLPSDLTAAALLLNIIATFVERVSRTFRQGRCTRIGRAGRKTASRQLVSDKDRDFTQRR